MYISPLSQPPLACDSIKLLNFKTVKIDLTGWEILECSHWELRRQAWVVHVIWLVEDAEIPWYLGLAGDLLLVISWKRKRNFQVTQCTGVFYFVKRSFFFQLTNFALTLSTDSRFTFNTSCKMIIKLFFFSSKKDNIIAYFNVKNCYIFCTCVAFFWSCVANCTAIPVKFFPG